jgi:hypothetical protein
MALVTNCCGIIMNETFLLGTGVFIWVKAAHSFFFFGGCSPKLDEIWTQIPAKLFEDLVEHLLDTTAYEGLVVASLSADKISSIRTGFLSSLRLQASVLATSLLVKRPSNLVHLELSGLIVTDDLVWALASSASATTLKTFICTSISLTNRSNKAWIKFSALETLRLLSCGFPVAADLADAISYLPALEWLEIQAEDWMPSYVSVISALLAPHSLPNLRNIDIPCVNKSLHFNEQLYNMLAQRPTAHLLENIDLHNRFPEGELLHDLFRKMHTMCPNLKHPFGNFEDFYTTEMISLAQGATSDIAAAAGAGAVVVTTTSSSN